MDKDSENNTIEAKLEEYRQLRAEIRHFLERRHKIINFAIIITLGVTSVGLTLNNYILFLLSALLIAFLWFDEIRRLQAIFRVATYIEVFIETEVAGLKWETLVGKHKVQTSFISRVISNAEFPLLFSLNSVLGLFLLIRVNTIIMVVIAFIFMVIFFTLSKKSHHVLTNGRNEEIEFWKKIKKELNGK